MIYILLGSVFFSLVFLKRNIAKERLQKCLDKNDIQHINFLVIEISEFLSRPKQLQIMKDCSVLGIPFHVGFSDTKVILCN